MLFFIFFYLLDLKPSFIHKKTDSKKQETKAITDAEHATANNQLKIAPAVEVGILGVVE